MSTPRTSTTPSPTLAATERPLGVAERVAVELDALTAAFFTLVVTRPTGDEAQAVRCAQLALIAARQAGWWRILTRSMIGDPTIPRVFHRAVIAAEHQTRDNARFWRDTAADWSARAQRRPTSDAAGALSNWDELGVSR